jgi:hypothetical protein
MQPDDVILLAENQLANASKGTRDYFFDRVIRYAEHAKEHQLCKGRPIPEAADEVAATAITARAMLDQLQAGWLWQLLTIPPKKDA